MTALLIILAAVAIVTMLGCIAAWLIGPEPGQHAAPRQSAQLDWRARMAILPAARRAEIRQTEVLLAIASLCLDPVVTAR